MALLEPSAFAVMVPAHDSGSSIWMEPDSWSNTVWNTRPSPESGACVAMVVIVPKQIVCSKGKAKSLGRWSSPQRLSSVHSKGVSACGRPREYVTSGASAEGVNSWKLKASGHWPALQVVPRRLTGLQPRTISSLLPALSMAGTPVPNSSSDRFSMHTSKVTLSLTSMAAASTPGHERFRHAEIDVVTDAWQTWADVNEESSKASWAQRASRATVGTCDAARAVRQMPGWQGHHLRMSCSRAQRALVNALRLMAIKGDSGAIVCAQAPAQA